MKVDRKRHFGLSSCILASDSCTMDRTRNMHRRTGHYLGTRRDCCRPSSHLRDHNMERGRVDRLKNEMVMSEADRLCVIISVRGSWNVLNDVRSPSTIGSVPSFAPRFLPCREGSVPAPEFN